MAQTLNTRGLVRSIKIKPSEYLLPLQEVVVNAIQSVEDSDNVNQGRIEIKIIKTSQQQLQGDGFDNAYMPIISFEVTDNGVGFNEERYKAFNEAFTSLNIKKGCKGVGRYSVLACFGSMEINSVFQKGKNCVCRKFKFDLINDIEPEAPNNLEETSSKVRSTTVKLNNYQERFLEYIKKKKITKENVAEEIIQHCLLYFLTENAPVIYVYYDDEKIDNAIILNDAFNDVVKFDRKEESIFLDEVSSSFGINYIRNYSSRNHYLHLCANNRQVGDKISLSSYIPSFNNIEDEGGRKYYLGLYLTGDFLDENVNNERNKLGIPLKTTDKNNFDKISLEQLFEQVSLDVKKKYSKEIEEEEEKRNARIQDYILNPEKPRLEYKHLLSVNGAFNKISLDVSDDRLEQDLHKISYNLEVKRKQKFDKFLKKKKYDKEEFGEIVTTILKEEAAFSQGKLADLMIRRKAIIELFRKYLKWRNEEEYMLEEDLHNIIFTMGGTEDNMPLDYHNLWLLDERLSFYMYTKSDKQLRTNEHIDSNSGKEPDLFIYDTPFVYSNNPDKVESLVIFEFKRPGRDMNTSKDKKLDSQVVEYFEKLLESKAKNEKGNFLNIEDSTPKFGYVVCELHRDLVDYNIKHNGFRKTPYGTLYKTNPALNQYIEIMSFEHMIDFAEKRHTAFF